MSYIEIYYMRVPDDIIEGFKVSFDESDKIKSVRKNEYENFTGGPPDIIMYISEHYYEMLISGILGSAAWETLRFSVSFIWKRLTHFYSKRKTVIQPDKNYISLNIKMDFDKTIEFNLEGNIDQLSIDQITNKIFGYLINVKQISSDFNNTSLRSGDSPKPKIVMRYNPDLKKWEPVNFEQLKKQMEKLFTEASIKFEN